MDITQYREQCKDAEDTWFETHRDTEGVPESDYGRELYKMALHNGFEDPREGGVYDIPRNWILVKQTGKEEMTQRHEFFHRWLEQPQAEQETDLVIPVPYEQQTDQSLADEFEVLEEMTEAFIFEEDEYWRMQRIINLRNAEQSYDADPAWLDRSEADNRRSEYLANYFTEGPFPSKTYDISFGRVVLADEAMKRLDKDCDHDPAQIIREYRRLEDEEEFLQLAYELPPVERGERENLNGTLLPDNLLFNFGRRFMMPKSLSDVK